MKVLLTGANGFLGSHILDRLQADRVPTRILLRQGCDVQFIQPHLARVEVHHGSLTDPTSLPPAFEGITHVIHCAGKTKALRREEYFEANQHGTRHLLEAMRPHASSIERLLFISSLAASRPATADAPAREDDPSNPVTEYGRSKLAGEQEVLRHSPVPFTIARPAAVYGPRDRDILVSIQCLRARVRPRFGSERQGLSLVYAPDAAAAMLPCLQNPKAAGKVYNLASPEVFTFAEVAATIGKLLNCRSLAVPLPAASLWLVCAAQDVVSRLTGRPHILSREKYPELTAPGWVCDVTRIRSDLGFVASTPLLKGMAETLAWYQEHQWL